MAMQDIPTSIFAKNFGVLDGKILARHLPTKGLRQIPGTLYDNRG